jgi:molybdenum cofactor cytidylyltransferase
VIAGLILAAGESSRMGQDKALLVYRGRTFLETIVQALRDAGLERIAVVLGHHAEEIRRAADLRGVEIVFNENYALGQTSSLQAGLRRLAGHEVEAVVLSLVDHPGFSAETIRKIVVRFREAACPVVIPTFQNQHGHPVLIARKPFDELLRLPPDAAANAVLRRHYTEKGMVEVTDSGILLDIDTPQAYQNLLK